MTTRVTPRKLAALVAAAKIENPAVAVAVRAVSLAGDKSLVFNAFVRIGAVDYELASTNGKIKLFSSLDDVVRVVAGAVPVGTGVYTVSVETGINLSAAVPNNLVKAAAAKVVRLGILKIAQNSVAAGIDTQLALMSGWAAGSPLQVARFAEVTAQKAAVVEDIAAIDAEVIALS